MKEERLHTILELIGWVAVFITVICILNSCGPCKKCPVVGQRDSIYVERVDSVFVKDTIIKVQMRDSVVYAVADSSSHLETDVAISEAWIENNRLHHRLSNKRDLIPIRVQMPMAISHERVYFQKIVPQKVAYITQMQSFWIVLGKIFAFTILGGLLLWLIKRRV